MYAERHVPEAPSIKNNAVFWGQALVAASMFTLTVCTLCEYTGKVGFEWDDESKAGLNFRKHGVRMPEAISVFDDPYAITIADDESDP